ncbi:uncharacterized protein LOC130993938 [Salvia miltiorrhiza]|uniref:uncharacterized protein LOC130993938 n=1 Tax=Salvia miltiorrhiza TaxID=226208 RepID=UPI0025AC5A10|nr:uncharacterized protein LOC130993938 [Salvia miltiorrhiza]
MADADIEATPHFCNCKIDGSRLRAPIMTSWTNDNPGRRFYGCRNWKSKNCGFFVWHDEPMGERARGCDFDVEKAELNYALHKMKNVCDQWRKKTFLAYSMLIFSWLLFFVIFFVL